MRVSMQELDQIEKMSESATTLEAQGSFVDAAKIYEQIASIWREAAKADTDNLRGLYESYSEYWDGIAKSTYQRAQMEQARPQLKSPAKQTPATQSVEIRGFLKKRFSPTFTNRNSTFSTRKSMSGCMISEHIGRGNEPVIQSRYAKFSDFLQRESTGLSTKDAEPYSFGSVMRNQGSSKV